MFAYGILQLSSNVVSAVALTVIALSFCSIKEESKVFNKCVEEIQTTGKSSADAVSFCNGGKQWSVHRLIILGQNQIHKDAA